MKKLLLIGVLLPLWAQTQKKAEISFDKFDSVKTVKSSREVIAKNKYGKLEAYVSNMVLMQEKFASHRDDFAPDVALWFKPYTVISIRKGESSVKIEFKDGKVNEYKYLGGTKIYSSNETALIYFSVDPDDKLLSDEIKAIRISYSPGNEDYEIKQDKQSFLKNMLLIVKEATEKESKQSASLN